MTQSIAQMRADMIAKVEAAQASHKAQIGAADSDKFVIFTGGKQAPVFINVDAVKQGNISISLDNATRYTNGAQAKMIASITRNGHGEPGSYMRVSEARALVIAQNESLLDMLRAAAA